MSRATEYLRTLGMSDEQITQIQAQLDQHQAEADHLIDHAVRLHRGSVEQAALEGALVRTHIDAYDETDLRGVFALVLGRAGHLAATIEDLSRVKARLEAELAAAREAQA